MSSLKQHARRANFQAAIWKRAYVALQDVPDQACGHGWDIKGGAIQPLWTEEEDELTLPQSVIDDLLGEEQTDSDDEDSPPPDFADFDFNEYDEDDAFDNSEILADEDF